jgi:outer membrane lipoprotein-sorting protein
VNRYIALLICSVSLSQFASAATSCYTQSGNPKKNPSAHQKQRSECKSGQIAEILSKMHNATMELKSCQAKLSYLFIQDPDLFESKTLQNGMLYYQKNDDRSQLRIRFDDIKQEDFDPEKRREEFLFDGVWLTRINFKLKQIDRMQKAQKNDPIGVFELISHNFPLVGFSNIEQLSKDFDIRLPEKPNESDNSIALLLSVKKGSKYENEYKKIDFRADAKTYMPQQIVAYSSQGDIYDIKFTELKINKKLKKAVFTIETPSDFRENTERLEEKPAAKGN